MLYIILFVHDLTTLFNHVTNINVFPYKHKRLDKFSSLFGSFSPEFTHVPNGVCLSVFVLVFVHLFVSCHRFPNIQAYSSLWPTILVGGG